MTASDDTRMRIMLDDEDDAEDAGVPNNDDNNGMGEILLVDDDDDLSSSSSIEAVREYLERILAAAQLLATMPSSPRDAEGRSLDPTGSSSSRMEVDPTIVTTRQSNHALVGRIASVLLQACRVACISTDSTSHLPPPLPYRQSLDDPLPPSHEEEDDDDDAVPHPQQYSSSQNQQHQQQQRRYRRVDYLRMLLRAMAPVAMDVAAMVCTQVQRHVPLCGQTLNSKDNNNDIPTAAFVLFGTWLPVAPHLAPLATALFSLYQQKCPLEQHPPPSKTTTTASSLSSGSVTQQCVVLEAAFLICRFYCDRLREPKTLLSWWHWTSVFEWLDQYSGRRTGEMTTTTTTTTTISVDDDAMDLEMKPNAQGTHSVSKQTAEETFSSSVVLVTLDEQALWYAVRVAAFVRNYSSGSTAVLLDKFGVRTEYGPWLPHPWSMEQEELVYQELQFLGRSKLLCWWASSTPENDNKYDVVLPSLSAIRDHIPLHSCLVHVEEGLVFYKHGSLDDSSQSRESPLLDPPLGIDSDPLPVSSQPPMVVRLVRTQTTRNNLAKIATALCVEPPILLCGPQGSGKSSLIRELARMFFVTVADGRQNESNNSLLEIHVDEETDTKTLVGSYTATDIPGEFAWRPGALTRAVTAGQWVLFEDLDLVPLEIQASLQPLFKDRILPLGNGGNLPCHPNFRLFATLTTAIASASTTNSGQYSILGGKRLLHPALWTKVQIDPLPHAELEEIAIGLYARIPPTIIESTFSVFCMLNPTGRQKNLDPTTLVDRDNSVVDISNNSDNKLFLGRDPSVRDLFKVLSRISNSICFEQHARYATESQRTLCLAEVVDVFAAACPSLDARREFVAKIASPCYGITANLGISYVETRGPTIVMHETSTEVGRVQVPVTPSQAVSRTHSDSFVQTSYVLRLMESIGVAVRENEPVLLVGETGTGKTSILQHLAQCCGRELIVQNLSLQTDSTDLLGGYRPLEMHHVARKLYQDFVDLFTGTFSRKQNSDFLEFAATAVQKGQWKKLSQCFHRASLLGTSKLKARKVASESIAAWEDFITASGRFEQQRMACDTGMAFVFNEGALVEAIRTGKWVLLDEINLASSESLQRLCGLLDDATSSLTLTERGDAVAIHRHTSFRLFAAMNPSTDSGKKDLSGSIRARFTELYVGELLDPVELRLVSARYISTVLPASNRPPEHTETIVGVVDLYLRCRDLAERVLVDGSGQKPRYTLRTLSRSLIAARTIVLQQKLSLHRALYEGFHLAFQGPLDENSLKTINRAICKSFETKIDLNRLDHPGVSPGGRDSTEFVLIEPFWINTGPIDPVDWSELNRETGRSRFILTPSTNSNLRKLARSIASGPWPVLLEGPTSAGKTTLVEYIAARCGHHVIRINNHEHTDIQEYTGGFVSDSNGSLSFMDGLLVRALRLGHWVILDELNLAPSEVLEALNRLLDDNRELYLPEINETVKPHANFRIFATQNPSGAYGGRKPLSRAFRNRFVEIQVNDIPSSEMITILEKRCGCPPSHSVILVRIMDALRQRRSKSGVFLGKDGFITPRDLLRWANRGASSKMELAQEGYMLLAERLRTSEEKECVKEEIERHLHVSVDVDNLYFGVNSEARAILGKVQSKQFSCRVTNNFCASLAPTRSLMRLVTLVNRCIKQNEPVLLVGGEWIVVTFSDILPML